MTRAGKTIECFNDIRKYLFEHKVPALTFIRDGKTEILYTQMYVDEKDKEIERLNNIIENYEQPLKFFKNRIKQGMSIEEQHKNFIWYVESRLQELKESDNNE